MTNLENFLEWYSKINKNKVVNTYSPHKPLTILFALAKALKGIRWIDFNSDRDALEELISSYSNTKPKILQPLWRLKNDSKIHSFWSVIPNHLTENSSGDISPADAKLSNFKAGFSDDIHNWLSSDRSIAQQLIDYIIEDNFPDTLHDDLLSQLGIDSLIPVLVSDDKVINIKRSDRDPNFPRKIMQAYDYRCSFCELKLYQGSKPFPMQAAHIKWKAQGGICHETNGLSLCPTHHYTFDKGIWTINTDYSIRLNPNVIIDERTDRFFKFFEGKLILRSLLNKNLAPKDEFINWHRENIFKATVSS